MREPFLVSYIEHRVNDVPLMHKIPCSGADVFTWCDLLLEADNVPAATVRNPADQPIWSKGSVLQGQHMPWDALIRAAGYNPWHGEKCKR